MKKISFIGKFWRALRFHLFIFQRFEGDSKYKKLGKRRYRIELIAKFLPENPVIFEAGARDGRDTARLAKRWEKAKIYSFEPVELNFKKLKKRTEQNRNIEIFPYALNDQNGTTTFYKTPFFNPGGGSLFKPKIKFFYSTKKTEVPCVILDDFCQKKGIEKLDFLWLDLEGAELKVLQSSPKILEKVRLIHTETNMGPYRDDMPCFDQLKKFLEEEGFTLLSHWYVEDFIGDAIFIRNDLYPKNLASSIL